MDTAAQQLHPSRGPVRLLLGSLLAGAGLTVLGFLLGGAPASADEPAPPAPLGSVVSGVTGGVGATVSGVTAGLGSTVSAVTGELAPALPAPVGNVVSAAVAPVADTVSEVAEAAPVAAVTQPVAAAVDQLVASTPVAGDAVGGLLGGTPVASVVSPVADTVDGVVGDVSGVLTEALAPVSVPGDGEPIVDLPGISDPETSLVRVGPTVSSSTFAIASAASSGAAGATLFRTSSAAVPVSVGMGAATAPRASAPGASGAPHGPGAPGAPLPAPGVPSGATGSSSGAGVSAPPAVAALASGAGLPAPALGGVSGALSDDRLPASPVADHDISPD